MGYRNRMTQKKITETLNEIRYKERRVVLEDDLRQRRFPMRERKSLEVERKENQQYDYLYK